MKKLTKADIQQEVFDLYDDYAHNRIDRRKFIDKLKLYAVGGITVPALLSFIMPDYETKLQVNAQDDRLDSSYIEYDSPKGAGTMKALLSKPINTDKKLPGIIVVHENRGLNPHIEDVSRRAALGGYIAVAPDALTPLGGYPGTDDEGRTMQRQRDRMEMLEDFIAAYRFLKSHDSCTGKIAVVGFCFGGWISNMMAARIPELNAAAPFYGTMPGEEEAVNINCPLLLHFAAFDKRVNEGWPAYAKILQDHNKEYSAHLYPDVNHGFHNDTTPRYDEEAATLAWKRTMDFFDKHLKRT